MRRFLFRIYWKLEQIIVPGLRSSQNEYADALEVQIRDRRDLLDIGCGRRPLPDWLEEQQGRILSNARRVAGIDMDMTSLLDHRAYPDKALASAYAIPFASASFDLAAANMVVEHLEDPACFFAELRRVLRPTGRVIFHTPNRDSWLISMTARAPDWLKLPMIRFFESRRSEDVFPTVYLCNRKSDVVRLAAENGFRVVCLRFVSTSALTVMLTPVVNVFELLLLRMLRRPGFETWRTNIICVLEAQPREVMD